MFAGGAPEAARAWHPAHRLTKVCLPASRSACGVLAAAASGGDQQPTAEGEGEDGAAQAPPESGPAHRR